MRVPEGRVIRSLGYCSNSARGTPRHQGRENQWQLFICDAPFQARENVEIVAARGRMLPSVRAMNASDRKAYWDLLETLHWIGTRDQGELTAMCDIKEDNRLPDYAHRGCGIRLASAVAFSQI